MMLTPGGRARDVFNMGKKTSSTAPESSLGNTPAAPGRKDGPVVIVDDDPADAMLAEGVFDVCQSRFALQILTSGEDLVAYLQGTGLYNDRIHYPYPGLILLDLNMPKMDGFAVLEWVRGHPEHGDVPIVVLSGFSDLVEQVTRAYTRGAHSFLPKPIQLQDIKTILSILKISI
jgi:two-component system response regulator